jgi:streptomycin 6-kinase
MSQGVCHPGVVAGVRIEVPDTLASSHEKYFGDAGRTWIAAAPDLAARLLDRWDLERDGEPMCGAMALVLPVVRRDGTSAMLKLQPVDDETVGEPVALRAWDGDGAVRLLEHDVSSGSLLLERLDADRTLATVADDIAALELLSELLARLTTVPAPNDVRRLSDLGADMLARVPPALALVHDRSHRLVIQACASALLEVLPEPGDRLLHWDLHYWNVLAPRASDPRAPWLAIDPKPLAGDPGFELLAALHNRWDDVVATGDVPRAIRHRFDVMTDILGLDRSCAKRWTLARVLQNMLWDIERGDTMWSTDPDRAIADVLLDSR